nr:unnamed protein product [Spirometra erinaceieuropaei]
MIHTQTLTPFFVCAPPSNPLMSAPLNGSLSPATGPNSCSTEMVQSSTPSALTTFFPSENYQCPTNKNDPAFSTLMSRISTSPFAPAVRPSPLTALPGQKLATPGYPATPIIAVRDSQWLKLRVCQAFARSSSAAGNVKQEEGTGDGSEVGGAGTDHCPFGADACPLAHPPPNVRVDQDHVTVCFDFMKRSDCRHTNCKYYHPPPHQIEAILKRGDVNKKNSNATPQSVRLHTPLVGQTPGLCWSPAALAPTLLPAGGLVSNPAAAAAAAAACLGSPGSSTVNMAMLAAMRGQQNAAFLGLNGQQPPGIYTPPTMSPSAAQVAQLTGAAAGDPGGALTTTFNGLYQVPASSATGQIMSGDFLCMSPGAVSSLAGGTASNQPNPALYMAALMAAATARQQQTTPSGTPNFSDNLAVSIASMSADRSAHAAATAQANSPGGGGQVAGRKREAISGDAAASGDGYGVWPPPKRANTTPNGISDGRSSVKTNGGEAADTTASEAGPATSLGETSTVPPGTYSVANSTSGAFVGGVNYGGIYNMATSTAAPGPMSPSLAAYTSTSDPTNSLANALAFNSILQQQQQQHLAAAAAAAAAAGAGGGGGGALGPLNSGVPPTAPTATNALTLAQQLQQQQVCMALLRIQQQNQLAAMAAAGAGGAYQAAALAQSHPLFSNFAYSAGLADPLSLQSSAAALSANTYALQNQPILTNVAYINDEGQLLESLPVCRDFKAGKCHRNADCRYVHLIDENVEVNQGRVTVCRDAAKGRCTRVPCKYYHIPLFAISASRSLALNSALAAAAAGGVNSAGATGTTNL